MTDSSFHSRRLQSDLSLLLISDGISLGEALRKLSETSERILFVVDPDRRLLGTVTDGDIRRGILRGLELDAAVGLVMRREFRSIRSGTPGLEEKAKNLMVSTRIEKIPVLDDRGRITEVLEWAELLKGPHPKPRTVAIIPARGGSKSIPLKNLKLIMGKPLLAYVVETCLHTPEIDKVVVSTESGRIRDVLRDFPEVVLVDRPKDLARDESTSEEAVLHALEELEKAGEEFETVLFAQATSPLSEPTDFSLLIAKVNEDGYDSAAFVVEDYGFFFGLDDVMTPRVPRQMRTPRKREAGNAWAFRKDGFLRHRCRLFGDVGLCSIAFPKNLEIDSYEDLVLTERLLQVRERKKRGLYYRRRESRAREDAFEEGYWGRVEDPDGRVRDRMEEREQRLDDLGDILAYISTLPGGRLLDLGCGTGELLSAVSDKWEVYGVELSAKAADVASQHGRVFTGRLRDAGFAKDHFDLVVMNHVIEHLPRPEEELGLVYGLLRPGGALIVATPDFDGAMAGRYKERYRLLHDQTHVSLFSRISLRHFLEDHGFEVEKEEFPFFETRYFTRENLLRLLDGNGVSPPFWGSFMTFYCRKK
ncbi:MAG: methyltransferase domain-containing protein [Nitrospirae bacterium]|nr:methyltransferase domain-containing protein [Nitrospirota bacterium]